MKTQIDIKALKTRLIGVEPALEIIQQTGGPAALAITTIHSVLVQLLDDATEEPSPKTTSIEGKPLDVVTSGAPAPAASPEVAITAAPTA